MSFRQGSENVYYTSTIRKSSHDSVDEYNSLSFQDIRNEPIVPKASDYEMSVVKFSIDTPSIPLYIAEIQPGPNTDPLKTIYTVNLSYLTGGVETFLAAPIPVQWVTRDFTDTLGTNPSLNPNGLQSITRAYNSYSYTDLIECINTSFVAAKAALDILFPILVPIEAPSLSWDISGVKADLYCRKDLYSEGLPDQIRVHISKSLYPLFSSFPVDKSKVTADRVEYRIRTTDFGTNNVIQFFGINSALKIEQEYSTSQTWSPYLSIVFTSNLLPFQTEYQSPPTIYSEGSLQAINENRNSYFNVITDLSSQDFSFRSNLLYLPTAEYRFVSLFGNSPIYKVDFNVYLQSKLGFYVPFTLHSNCSVLLKILFRKKKQ